MQKTREKTKTTTEMLSAQKTRKKIKITTLLVYFVLIIHAIGCLFPLLWTINSSFKTNNEILMYTMRLPTRIVLENYVEAWEGGMMIVYYFNTIIVALGATFVTLLISSMATYVLARVRPNLALYTYFVMGIMLPVYIIMLPFLRILVNLGINDTLFGLGLAYVVVLVPQTFFILYGYMRGLPKELEEAATIDGCSRVGVFAKIIIPLSKPGLGTVGIFSLLFSWNEFLLPLVITRGRDIMVLSLAIRHFQAAYLTHYGAMTARLVLSVAPVLVFYLLFQNNVVKGMTAGAVKG
jgi:raffinose/stachyose/melibiose transport system permease protein